MPLTATLWVSRLYYFTNNTTHKMKTPLLLVSILCGMALTSIAAPRSLSQAKAIAAKFAAQKGGSAKKAARRALTCAHASEADRPYYVFNQGDNQGFTIVSADDVLPEIVGYADTGAFDDGNMPEGLAAFMDAYRKTATAILAGDKDATDNMNKLTAIRSAGKATAVSPLLRSMAWNQSEPYNNQCPLWNGTDRAVTGCVATAMAQVMAYYKYPATLQADIPSYKYRYELTTEPIAKGAAYDWDNMLPRYTSGSYTEAQANAVAKLMFHCGAAVKMKYGPVSAAAVRPAQLSEFFGYDADLMQEVYRKSVTLDKWIELLDGELQAGRPILYSGTSSTGGHQYVCDGRDEDGLYHINWGWGGSYNGYFDINILNPDYQGSFPAEDGYTRDACIVIGIAPDNGKVDKPLMEKPSSHVGQYYYNNLKWTRQKRNNASESFAGSVDIVFCNPTDKDFDGMAGLGIKDDDGNVKLITKAVNLDLPKQKGNATCYKSYTFDFDYAFPKGCTILYGVYSYDGTTWQTCVPNKWIEMGKLDYLNLKATDTEISQAKRIDLTASITTYDEVIRNTTSNVDIVLHNNLPEEYLGKISVFVSETGEKPSAATGEYTVSVPGKGKTTRTMRISPASEKAYIWVCDELGNSIVSGHALSTVAHAAPAVTLTSAKMNATPGLYETKNAYYKIGELLKAPCTNEEKATFDYDIRNTGGRTYRTFVITCQGLPDGNTKKFQKTLTLEPNSVNHVTMEATPEEMGSKFIRCSLTMTIERDGATMSSEVERQRIDRIPVESGYYTFAPGWLLVYVGGKEATGVQQPTVDDPLASGTSAKVYDLKGNLVDGFATRESFGKLPQGIYIVNGKKLLKK